MTLTIPAITRSLCILRKPCDYTITLDEKYYRNSYIMYAQVPDEMANEKNTELNLPEEMVDRIFDIDTLMLKKDICKIQRVYYDKKMKNKHAKNGEVFIPYYAVEIRDTGDNVDIVEFLKRSEAVAFFDVLMEWVVS
jgi:hypothetical protein